MSLFVGRVASSVTRPDLEDLFGRYGRLERCEVKSGKDPNSNFAFVQFVDDQEAEDALRALQRYELHGKNINVEWSKESGKFKSSNMGRSHRHVPYRAGGGFPPRPADGIGGGPGGGGGGYGIRDAPLPPPMRYEGRGGGGRYDDRDGGYASHYPSGGGAQREPYYGGKRGGNYYDSYDRYGPPPPSTLPPPPPSRYNSAPPPPLPRYDDAPPPPLPRHPDAHQHNARPYPPSGYDASPQLDSYRGGTPPPLSPPMPGGYRGGAPAPDRYYDAGDGRHNAYPPPQRYDGYARRSGSPQHHYPAYPSPPPAAAGGANERQQLSRGYIERDKDESDSNARSFHGKNGSDNWGGKNGANRD